MPEIFPSDIEAAYQAGQIDEPSRNKAMRNLQVQTNYLPIRYAQTWWHTMEETVDAIVKQSNERSFPVAAAMNTLSLLGALYAPITAAAHELSRPVDGFLIDLGASPKMAATTRHIGEFLMNLVPAERIVSAAGGLQAALSSQKIPEIVKVIKEAGKELPTVVRRLTPGAQARAAREAVGQRLGKAAEEARAGVGPYDPRLLRKLDRIEAETLLDQLITPEGQQAVRVAATQSDELQRIMAEGERSAAGKGAAVLSEQKLQAFREEEARLTPIIKSLEEQGTEIVARNKAMREAAAQRNLQAETQGGGGLAVDTGIDYAEIQAKQLQQMRDELAGYLETRRAQATTSETLQAAQKTITLAPTAETQKTLEAAQATILGRSIPEQTLNDLENMRKRLVDRGCL